MTHHSVRSPSVSHRTRSRATVPQGPTSDDSPPIRVRRGARLRVRSASKLHQSRHEFYQLQHQLCEPSWAALEDTILPSLDDIYQSGIESSEDSPELQNSLLPLSHQDFASFDSPASSSNADYSSLPYTTNTTTPPTQYGVRAASESSISSGFPAVTCSSDNPSLEGEISWSNSPEPLLPTNSTYQEPQDMSTLGFVMPVAHFAPLEPFPSSIEPSILLMDPPSYLPSSSSSNQILPTPTSAPSTAYHASFPSSPALLGNSPALSERQRSNSQHDQRTLPYQPRGSPYQSSQGASSYQQPLGSPYSTSQHSAPLRASPAPLNYTHSQQSSGDAPSILNAPVQPSGYSSLSSSLPSQGTLGGMGYGSSYPPPQSYVSSNYAAISSYHYPPSSNSSYPPPYLPASTLPSDSSSGILGANPSLPSLSLTSSAESSSNAAAAAAAARNVRVINQRPKPQCWEHGCNGRQFSTFSNLLRHQREKSGTAGKSYCPRCGAEFTRTTAMKGHMNNDKCKPRRTSNAASEGGGSGTAG